MRRWLLWLFVLTAACGLAPRGAAGPSATVPRPTAVPSVTAAPPSPTRRPASATRLPPTPVPASATPAPSAGYTLTAADIHFHPDPALYSGDIVSIEVVAAGAPRAWEGAPVRLFLTAPGGTPLAEGTFARFGLAGRLQATFTWAWDTHGLVGPQTLVVEAGPRAENSTAPARQQISVTVRLLPADQRPAPELQARWADAESVCCIFHYLTGTAAARDIDAIRAEADAAFSHIESVLGVQPQQKVTFTLLSRLLGHGGFASGEVSLSYLDRNPATSSLYSLFAHEGTHILDRQIAATRPTFLTEGLAVYVAGGHFKPEPLEPRAAALLALNRYEPLKPLANGFYAAQHETGYLEAAAFIQYLVERFGWDRFKAMYGALQAAPSEAQMLDAGLQAQYGEGLAALEAEWLAYLRALPANVDELNDLKLTVELYDTLRLYQQTLDPSAYFLTAWLPDGAAARQRGIVADFLRHPTAPENLALETMLMAAGDDLGAHDYAAAAAQLAGVQVALRAGRLSASPPAAEQLAVVDQVLAAGFEPQHVSLAGDTATVSAIRQWPRLDPLVLRRGAGGWQVLASGALRPAAPKPGFFDGIIELLLGQWWRAARVAS